MTFSRPLLIGLLIDIAGVAILAITVLYATSIDWDFERRVAIGPVEVSSAIVIAAGALVGIAGVAIGLGRVLIVLRGSRPTY